MSAATRPVRHRPWHRLRRRRTDRLLEPLLPVPPAPPHQDVRPRLALRAACRRSVGRPHAERSRAGDPTTGLVSRRRTRSTMARRGGPTRPAPLLTRAPVTKGPLPSAPRTRTVNLAASPPGLAADPEGVVACSPDPPPFTATLPPSTSASLMSGRR